MKRLSLHIPVGIASVAAVALACAACGSGHQPNSAPTSREVVVHHSAPAATSRAVPAPARHRPATGGRMRISTNGQHRAAVTSTAPSGTPTGHRRAAVVTKGPSGMPNFRLPRSSQTMGTSCGGRQAVHVAGSRPVPVRVMCPPS